MSAYLDLGAGFSDDGIHRYWLSRRLSMGERSVLFIGLNPSTADAVKDDPTIRKAAGFARRWGFDWLYMGNLHAYRSTDPKGLRGLTAGLAIGPGNTEALRWMVGRVELVIAAWGANPLHPEADILANWILGLSHCRTFGTTKDGKPPHPLYLPYETQLVEVHMSTRLEIRA